MTQPPEDGKQPGNVGSTGASADEEARTTAGSEASEPADDLVTTEHSVSVYGPDPALVELKYSVMTGRIVLRREGHTDDKFDGPQPKAEVFVTAYTAQVEDPARRPVTFVVNGGRGASRRGA